MSIPLLLTATTNPGETINVTVNSVEDRRQQYLETLEFYLAVGVLKKSSLLKTRVMIWSF